MAREAGPGFPPIIEEKPVGYHDRPCSIWQRLPYRSDTGGVSNMWLEGREAYMIERMRGMTPERRAYRKQFLKDQILSPREPVFVPEYYNDVYNPVMRLWKKPFEKLHKFLEPKIGFHNAEKVRGFIKYQIFFVSAVYIGTYLALFYANDWQHVKKMSFHRNKPIVWPGDPAYPYVSNKFEDDYYDLGFKSSTMYKSEEQIRADYEAEKQREKMKK